GQGPAAEPGNQAVDGPQQGGLPGPGGPDHQGQFARGHVEVDVRQGGTVGVGIGEGDRVESDHAASLSGVASTGEGRGGVISAGRAATSTAPSPSGPATGHVSGSREGWSWAGDTVASTTIPAAIAAPEREMAHSFPPQESGR